MVLTITNLAILVTNYANTDTQQTHTHTHSHTHSHTLTYKAAFFIPLPQKGSWNSNLSQYLTSDGMAHLHMDVCVSPHGIAPWVWERECVCLCLWTVNMVKYGQKWRNHGENYTTFDFLPCLEGENAICLRFHERLLQPYLVKLFFQWFHSFAQLFDFSYN